MSTIEQRMLPILFNAQMVQAIRNKKKTQTRRPINSLPGFGQISELQESTTPGYDWQFRCKRGCWQDFRHDDFMKLLSKFGSVGDRLWVRETWSPDHLPFYPYFPIVYRADGYPAAHDVENGLMWSSEHKQSYPFKWRPAIHMNYFNSRIKLEITDVRLQRLDDVTNEEAEAEGFTRAQLDNGFGEMPFGDGWTISSLGTSASAAGMFMLAWDEIYGNAGDNPIVIARTFKLLEGTDGK